MCQLRAALLPELRDLQVGRHVAGLIEDRVSHFDWHLLDQGANAELLLTDDLDANHVLVRVKVEHDEAFLRSKRFGARNRRSRTKPDVGGRGLRIDLDDRGLRDRDHETLKAALPNIR